MTKKMWGGRFSKKTDPLVEEFTKSIHYDHKLAKYDVIGSLIHVSILKEAGYLTSQEASKLEKGLKKIQLEIQKGTFKYDPSCEDIHTNIQNILLKNIGNVALKLHTARSRNEQVVFATKLYCNEQGSSIAMQFFALSRRMEQLSNKNRNLILPGFTHLQHAQPVLLDDYLTAYLDMIQRDIDRLSFDNLSMGAGALSGTPIKSSVYVEQINKFKKKNQVFRFLGDSEELTNSLDVVSSRDFVLENLFALSLLAMHLSRLAEDLILWSTKEFDFIEIDDAYCTGSSLMPQKKNPDVLELIRGYTGRLYGNLVSVLTMMKGLPLTYNRDMQLDKEPLFNSFEIVSKALDVLTGVIKTLKFNKLKIEEHLKDESLYATDLVYYLVNKGIAFKDAHTIVGKLIKYSLDNNIEIKNMPENKLKDFSNKFTRKEVIRLFDPKISVESKKSIKR